MSKNGEFRQFHLGFWASADVENLDPLEKLLYNYMITAPKSNMEGVYKTTLRRIAFETGIDRDMIPKMIKRFEASKVGGILINDDGKAWVVVSSAPDFMPGSPMVKRRFEIQMQEWPAELIEYMRGVGYHWPKWDDEPDKPTENRPSTDRLPTVGRHDTDTRQDNTNTIQDKTDVPSTDPPASPPAVKPFKEWLEEYANRSPTIRSPSRFVAAVINAGESHRSWTELQTEYAEYVRKVRERNKPPHDKCPKCGKKMQTADDRAECKACGSEWRRDYDAGRWMLLEAEVDAGVF